jgi:hypothetical protein
MRSAKVHAEHAADTYRERLRGAAGLVALDHLDGVLWTARVSAARMRRHAHQSPLRRHSHPLRPRVITHSL